VAGVKIAVAVIKALVEGVIENGSAILADFVQ
jgi:hypothetical protein